MAHAAFGGMTALVWLLLVPLADTAGTDRRAPGAAADRSAVSSVGRRAATAAPPTAVATATAAVTAASAAVAEWSAGPVATGPSPAWASAAVRRAVAVGVGAPAAGDDDGSAADLILPVAVAGAAVGLAAYSLVRRRRRAALRTTPAGTFEQHLPPPADLHRRGRRLLVETDDGIRTGAEELRFAVARSGRAAAEPFADALADARRESEAAFLIRQRLDDATAGTLPPDEERVLLEEILARCTMAQRRLDIAAPAFDQLRALERDMVPALQCAEARFRELTGRTATAAATVAGLREHYAPAVVRPVAGHAEHAEDRLVFATAELNRARRFTDSGDPHTAAVHLRSAEGAIDQADVFVTGVERLAAEVARAAETLKQGAAPTGTYDDPLDVLCRRGRWLLPARSTVAATADYITTHRGAVGVTARTRLAEARRWVERAEAAALHDATDGPDRPDGTDRPEGTAEAEPPGDGNGEAGAADGTRPADETTDETTDEESARRAHSLAREARRLAEQDVRDYGDPYEGPVGDGMAGALLGGIVLGDAQDGGRVTPRGPACFGGTATRGRRVARAG